GGIGVLAMDERHEPAVRELRLSAVADRDLRGAFHVYAAVVARERVDRQALDRSAGFDAANGRAPAVVLERTIDVHSHRISRVRPGVAAVIACARLFLEVELFDR